MARRWRAVIAQENICEIREVCVKKTPKAKKKN